MLFLYKRYFSYLAGRFIKLLVNPRLLAWAGTFALLSATLMPTQLNAAQIKPRKMTLGSSAPSASTTHDFEFTVPTTSNVGSVRFTYCTTSSGPCTAPAGLNVDDTVISVTTQTDDGVTFTNTFTDDAASNASEILLTTTTANSVTAASAIRFVISGAVNPSATNTTFFIFVKTYASTDGTGTPVDTGTAAASTANQIELQGFMPESLTFCVSEDFVTDEVCASASGDNIIDFGDFSSSATSSAFSEMIAATNAENGYIITVNGTTLTSGSNTIPACAAGCTSTVGTSQFGTNLRDNATPNIGRDPTTPVNAIGTYSANYGTVDTFRFGTGETVAQAVEETNANTFTNSYIVNVEPRQASGNYAATMTYICTATF